MALSAPVTLELVDISGRCFPMSVPRSTYGDEVATRLQKKLKCRTRPVLIADGKILDPASEVKDFEGSPWQFHIPSKGVSVENWKVNLSFWQKHPVTIRQVELGLNCFLRAEPVGAGRLLVYCCPGDYDYGFGKPDDFLLVGLEESEGGGALMTRRMALPLEDPGCVIRLTCFEGTCLYVAISLSEDDPPEKLLRFDLRDATQLDFQQPHFVRAEGEQALSEIFTEWQLSDFLKLTRRDVQESFIQRYSDHVAKKFEEFVMPTTTRRGHMAEGAIIFNKRTQRQVGKIGVDHEYNGGEDPGWFTGASLSYACDGRTLLDTLQTRPGAYGDAKGLRVFDVATGKLVQEADFVPIMNLNSALQCDWWLCAVERDDCKMGFVPGDSQSLFTMTRRGALFICTPDQSRTLAEVQAEQAAAKIARAENRAARLQAERAEKERRAAAAQNLDINPHWQQLLIIRRAIRFCAPFQGHLSTHHNAQTQRQAKHQRHQKGVIKHTPESINTFNVLKLPIPTRVEQLPGTLSALEAQQEECQRLCDHWEMMQAQRSEVQRRIIKHGNAPAGVALLRLAFGFSEDDAQTQMGGL
eukprot:TRINITY_DN14418_c0_g2_i1.p1 TRINITY_DN14418_c0_g2~~TRINITY_DN14418_c0_g2_i1.p1  ORF type:complete len:592 (+),score=100.76 TRINITY_DN14418_c0_g2_i1:28-1776(+)